jgi:pimeloyl-ACP methyl ester carboxylesterase
MKSHFLIVLPLVVAITALSSPTGDTQQPPATGLNDKAYSQLQRCRVPGVAEELLCGKLEVFENRQARSGRTIKLNIIVLPALEQSAKQEPLFDLAGGPGGASTEAAGFYATAVRDIRLHRDVVLVDQRGTGQSNPLQCPHDTTPQHFLSEMYPIEYVKNCRQVLEQHADLTQYITPIAMDDLDDVRAWLGYERINLFGLSYGSRAALVYMREHPAHVRSVVLMGVDPPYQKLPLYHARDGQRAMYLLLDECAADSRCSATFPHVKQELRRLAAQLKRQPALVSYEQNKVEITRDVFTEKLRSLLYAPETARRIPFIVHRAAGKDFGPFLNAVVPKDRNAPDFIADGMYLSVTCAEDIPFIDPAFAARLNKGNLFDNYRVVQQRRACRLWPRARLPKDYHQPISSDLPVLVLTGYMDPVTPPQWAEGVAGHLPNSQNVIIRHNAHLPNGLAHIDCLNKLVLDFLNQGSAKGLDTSCVEQMTPPEFQTRPDSGRGAP